MAKCQNTPIYRYTWPGKDEAYVCWQHAPALRNVSNAMGLHLQLIDLSMERRMSVNCSQEVREEQKIEVNPKLT